MYQLPACEFLEHAKNAKKLTINEVIYFGQKHDTDGSRKHYEQLCEIIEKNDNLKEILFEDTYFINYIFTYPQCLKLNPNTTILNFNSGPRTKQAFVIPSTIKKISIAYPEILETIIINDDIEEITIKCKHVVEKYITTKTPDFTRYMRLQNINVDVDMRSWNSNYSTSMYITSHAFIESLKLPYGCKINTINIKQPYGDKYDDF